MPMRCAKNANVDLDGMSKDELREDYDITIPIGTLRETSPEQLNKSGCDMQQTTA